MYSGKGNSTRVSPTSIRPKVQNKKYFTSALKKLNISNL
jgi:hypothetical protein